jgi:hypothetical protein
VRFNYNLQQDLQNYAHFLFFGASHAEMAKQSTVRELQDVIRRWFHQHCHTAFAAGQ